MDTQGLIAIVQNQKTSDFTNEAEDKQKYYLNKLPSIDDLQKRMDTAQTNSIDYEEIQGLSKNQKYSHANLSNTKIAIGEEPIATTNDEAMTPMP